jgi:hypothetical protein
MDCACQPPSPRVRFCCCREHRRLTETLNRCIAAESSQTPMGVRWLATAFQNESAPPKLARPQAGQKLSQPKLQLATLHPLRHLQKPTKRIRQLHLPRRLAFRRKKSRAPHQYRRRLRPRRRNIQPIQTVQKLHPPRRQFRRRSRQRINRHRRLLSLEFINGADANVGPTSREPRSKLVYLFVVRRHD